MYLDHDIFSKKSESLILATKVKEFLKAQGRLEPTQIPFGHSGIKQNVEAEYQSGQQSMRDMMTQSISANRPVLKKC